MYHLAKDMEGNIGVLRFSNPLYRLFPLLDLLRGFNFRQYSRIITFIYPMHLFGRTAQKQGIRWVCYDQKVPEPHYFKNFWRRQYIRLFRALNDRSMKGADEYRELSEIPQKPRWTAKFKAIHHSSKALCINKYGVVLGEDHYALYLGRTTDYKNFGWLQNTMNDLKIHLVHPKNESDNTIWELLSNAKMLVTASLWEGYGRGPMEAQALGIPVVCYDVGNHKQLVKNGFVVPVGNEKEFIQAIIKVWSQNGM